MRSITPKVQLKWYLNSYCFHTQLSKRPLVLSRSSLGWVTQQQAERHLLWRSTVFERPLPFYFRFPNSLLFVINRLALNKTALGCTQFPWICYQLAQKFRLLRVQNTGCIVVVTGQHTKWTYRGIIRRNEFCIMLIQQNSVMKSGVMISTTNSPKCHIYNHKSRRKFMHFVLFIVLAAASKRLDVSAQEAFFGNGRPIDDASKFSIFNNFNFSRPRKMSQQRLSQRWILFVDQGELIPPCSPSNSPYPVRQLLGVRLSTRIQWWTVRSSRVTSRIAVLHGHMRERRYMPAIVEWRTRLLVQNGLHGRNVCG